MALLYLQEYYNINLNNAFEAQYLKFIVTVNNIDYYFKMAGDSAESILYELPILKIKPYFVNYRTIEKRRKEKPPYRITKFVAAINLDPAVRIINKRKKLPTFIVSRLLPELKYACDKFLLELDQ